MLERQTTRREVQTVQRDFDCGGEAMIAIYVQYGQISVSAAVYARLDEWARWARPRMGFDVHGRCSSAEGNYVAAYPDADRGACAIQPDLPAVLAVERVVCNPMFPRVPREIIRRHFIVREVPKDIARALGINGHRYGDELKRSILMIKNRLTMH
jgi:hypothetical protein